MRLQIKQGTEGPKHDPYSFQELIAYLKGNEYKHKKLQKEEERKIIFHQGLSEYIRIENNKGESIYFYDKASFEGLDKIFEHECGLNDRLFRRSYSKINFPSKCPKCGSKKMFWQDGFPGEEVRVCSKCNHVTGYIFSESKII